MSENQQTDEELFAALGDQIATSSRMGMPLSGKQKELLGRKWFTGHLSDIRAGICGNKTIEDLATKSDTAALATAVTPLIGFSPSAAASATIAVLIARIGVRNICSEQWKG